MERRQSLRRVSLDHEIDRYSPSKERLCNKSESLHQLPSRHSTRNTYKRIDYSEDQPSSKRSRKIIDDDDDDDDNDNENNNNNDDDEYEIVNKDD